MQNENIQYEKKSLKLFTGKNPDWRSLAKDCVCFANAKGGKIIIGIEDREKLPAANQTIEDNLVERIRKRISELTINVGVDVRKKNASNGGEYVEIIIYPSQTTIASTTDGQYYIRISDHCKPIFLMNYYVYLPINQLLYGKQR